jgi:hypothetical protein
MAPFWEGSNIGSQNNDFVETYAGLERHWMGLRQITACPERITLPRHALRLARCRLDDAQPKVKRNERFVAYPALGKPLEAMRILMRLRFA